MEHIYEVKDLEVSFKSSEGYTKAIDGVSFHIDKGEFYLPTSRDRLSKLPEILIHYLILYNLSMISRYETEWWYDLLLGSSNDDYPFILRYMEIAKRKIPYFVLNFIEHSL